MKEPLRKEGSSFMTQDSYTSFISKPEISFWVPILVSVITISLSYGVLMSRVAVLENKVDTLSVEFHNLSVSLTERYNSEETRYGQLSIRITRIETLEGIK